MSKFRGAGVIVFSLVSFFVFKPVKKVNVKFNGVRFCTPVFRPGHPDHFVFFNCCNLASQVLFLYNGIILVFRIENIQHMKFGTIILLVLLSACSTLRAQKATPVSWGKMSGTFNRNVTLPADGKLLTINEGPGAGGVWLRVK